MPDIVKKDLEAEAINEAHREATAGFKVAKEAANSGLDWALACGEMLTEKKAEVKAWTKWVKANLDFSMRTTQRYMDVYAGRLILEKKRHAVSFLSFRGALNYLQEERRAPALLAAPQESHEGSTTPITDIQPEDALHETPGYLSISLCFRFYVENQDTLVDRWDGRVIVLRMVGTDFRVVVIKDFDTVPDAYWWVVEQGLLGSVMIQMVGPGEANYTVSIRTSTETPESPPNPLVGSRQEPDSSGVSGVDSPGTFHEVTESQPAPLVGVEAVPVEQGDASTGGSPALRGKAKRKPSRETSAPRIKSNPDADLIRQVAQLKKNLLLLLSYLPNKEYYLNKEAVFVASVADDLERTLNQYLRALRTRSDVRANPPTLEEIKVLAEDLGFAADDAVDYFEARDRSGWHYGTPAVNPVRDVRRDMPAYLNLRRKGEAKAEARYQKAVAHRQHEARQRDVATAKVEYLSEEEYNAQQNGEQL